MVIGGHSITESESEDELDKYAPNECVVEVKGADKGLSEEAKAVLADLRSDSGDEDQPQYDGHKQHAGKKKTSTKRKRPKLTGM